ncbi:MAG: N-acetylmuramic acid 6-phosphate etherase [Candidatus Kapaibacterium sp.]|nr:MAG: N-acetylmuramic acid 6-phosphate etherase [Candidatus Kapabacteria bacterium]
MNRTLFEQIRQLRTEQPNPASAAMDAMATEDFLRMMNDEDQKVALAVREEIPHIAAAAEAITRAFACGGRLLYVGAGTSGRLGIMDAAECPPTFGVPPTMVRGIIAGGPPAVFAAQEGAEDDPTAGAEALAAEGVGSSDVVCGISASGRTPFVLGALEYAKACSAVTVLVTTNDRRQVEAFCPSADIIIAPNVGPEILAGSTRLKSGTAQKLVLNMLSTAAMVRIGKTYGNIMVDVQPLSAKLRERACGIVMQIAGVDYDVAASTLQQAGGNVKAALVMLLAGCDASRAQTLLQEAAGSVRKAVHLHNGAKT